MNALKRFWNGELALPAAFWNWAVFGGLIVNLTSSAAFLFLIMAERPVTAAIAGYGFSVPFNVVALVGVWRSAARYDGDQKWAETARLVTVVAMLFFSVT